MKKVIFMLAVTIGGLCGFQASAQVAVSVKISSPLYYKPPTKVIVVAPAPPPKVVVIKPASIIVIPVRSRIIMQPPVYVAARPARKVVIYR